jgi:multidrug resistance efflux pump
MKTEIDRQEANIESIDRTLALLDAQHAETRKTIEKSLAQADRAHEEPR